MLKLKRQNPEERLIKAVVKMLEQDLKYKSPSLMVLKDLTTYYNQENLYLDIKYVIGKRDLKKWEKSADPVQ